MLSGIVSGLPYSIDGMVNLDEAVAKNEVLKTGSKGVVFFRAYHRSHFTDKTGP